MVSPSTMRAIVLDSVPAPPEALVVRERPLPQPEPGWVLIEVKAFGLNRSELKTRLGLADPDVTLPRVLGIEATGVMATILAKGRGLTVLATTRSAAKAGALQEVGADHVVLDDGAISERVRELVPGGVDATLELVGTPTLRDSLNATRMHGVVCSAGYLSNEWIVPDFTPPAGYLPRGVRLAGYNDDASDLPQPVLQEFLDAVAAGEATVPIARIYTMDEITTAHDDMEHDRVSGKLVVSTGR